MEGGGVGKIVAKGDEGRGWTVTKTASGFKALTKGGTNKTFKMKKQAVDWVKKVSQPKPIKTYAPKRMRFTRLV